MTLKTYVQTFSDDIIWLNIQDITRLAPRNWPSHFHFSMKMKSLNVLNYKSKKKNKKKNKQKKENTKHS